MPKKPKRKTKPKRKHRVLKVKHPVVVPPLDSEPVRALVEAIEAKEIVAIHFKEPCPTRWERLKKWLANE